MESNDAHLQLMFARNAAHHPLSHPFSSVIKLGIQNLRKEARKWGAGVVPGTDPREQKDSCTLSKRGKK